MASDSQILASYHERIRGLVDRKLDLYADKIRVYGTVAGRRIDAYVMLRDLKLPPHHMWARSRHAIWSSQICALLAILFGLAATVWPKTGEVLLGIGALLLPATIYFLCSRRENEYRLYQGASGFTILDVCRSGPDAVRFGEFIQRLEELIAQNLDVKIG